MPGFMRRSRLPTAGAALKFLAQDIAAPVEFAGFTKEDSTYSGPAMKLQRVDNNAVLDIGWAANGKDWDAAGAASFLSGTTGLITTMYGQRLISNLTQATKANMPPLRFDDDGLPMIGTGPGYWLESTNTAFKSANVHAFIIAKRQYLKASTNEKPNGCFFQYGAGGYLSSRWGLGIDAGNYAPQIPRNGSNNIYDAQGQYGEAYFGKWAVHDYNANTTEYRVDKDVIYSGVASATLTYPTTDKLTLGNDANNSNPWPDTGIRAFAFYGAQQTSTVRNAITDHLQSQASYGVAYLPKTTTSPFLSGFTFAPIYLTTNFGISTADANGLTWVNENQCYPWTGWVANNVNNGKTLTRYELHDDDADNLITNANRAERSSNNGTVTPGQTMWMYADYFIEQCPASQAPNSSDWSYIFQIHYNEALSNAFTPDLFCVSLKGNVFQVQSQQNGNTINHGAAQTLVIGSWMSLLVKITWSTPVTSGLGTMEVWHGAHGATLTKIVNETTPISIFDNKSGLDHAYLKQGWYRGDPLNNPSPVSICIANHQFTTSGDLSGYVTTPPALPTH